MPRPQVHAPPARLLLGALVLLVVVPGLPLGRRGREFLGALGAIVVYVMIVNLLDIGSLGVLVVREELLGIHLGSGTRFGDGLNSEEALSILPWRRSLRGVFGIALPDLPHPSVIRLGRPARPAPVAVGPVGVLYRFCEEQEEPMR